MWAFPGFFCRTAEIRSSLMPLSPLQALLMV
jgi:hypothetical protein